MTNNDVRNGHAKGQQPFPAVALNNGGANCIECGDYSSALHYFSSAFHSCKVNAKKLNFNVEDLHGISRIMSVTTIDNPLIVMDDWMDVADECELDENRNFFYNEPIHIPRLDLKRGHKRRSYDGNKKDFLVSCCIAISFNLGIAYHNQAITRSDLPPHDIEQILRKSLKAFQYSFKLQRTKCGRASQSTFFYMAVMNNLGILHQKLGEVQNARQYFERLLSVLIYTMSRTNVSTDEYQDFFQNAAQFTHQSYSVGAGAA